MRYERLAAKLFNQPLMISGDSITPLLDYFTKRVNGEIKSDSPHVRAFIDGNSIEADTTSSKYYDVIGKSAIIPIDGELVDRGGWMRAQSGMTSYQYISQAIIEAESDKLIDEIVFRVNSPGGMVSGCFELCQQIASLSKPTVAIADTTAISAAYAISASADKFLSSNTAMVGSIGVITIHMDKRQQSINAGVTPTVISAGQDKALMNPMREMSDESFNKIQEQIESVRLVFADQVSQKRKISTDEALATEAKSYIGKEALVLGLIDEIMTWSDFAKSRSSSPVLTKPKGGITMSDQIAGGGAPELSAEIAMLKSQLEASQRREADAKAAADKAMADAEAARHAADADMARRNAIAALPSSASNLNTTNALIAAGVSVEAAAAVFEAMREDDESKTSSQSAKPEQRPSMTQSFDANGGVKVETKSNPEIYLTN